MSSCGPWVFRVEFPVNQSVECHCRGAGKDHAEDDSEQILPSENRIRLKPGNGCCEKRERQSEDGVTETNQLKKMANSAPELVPAFDCRNRWYRAGEVGHENLRQSRQALNAFAMEPRREASS